MAKAKFDVYQSVTDEIVAQLEAGTSPWQKPWTGGGAGACLPLRWNGSSYRGINVLLLWATASALGYGSARWMTYRQALELGGQVRKGEKSTTVVKYGTVEKEAENGKDKAEAITIGYARAYRVFNADQIEGLDQEFHVQPDPPRNLGTEADAELTAFFDATGAEIVTSPEPRAYYDIRNDRIHMPPVETFLGTSHWAATLLHELGHFTGATHRLNRFGRFGDKAAYAKEELVAEISSAMTGAIIGVEPMFDQNAAYLESWINALKGDARLIFKAASAAQKATDYLLEQVAANGWEAAA